MKAEIPQWILDCIDNRNPARCAEAVEELLAIIEKLESGKPDWNDAPEWAEWRAMDEDGAWWWYESQPQQGFDAWLPLLNDQAYKLCDAPRPINWKDTLEKRPTHEKE